MNNYDNVAFECLCSDLGLTLVRGAQAFPLAARGALKNELLDLVHGVPPSNEYELGVARSVMIKAFATKLHQYVRGEPVVLLYERPIELFNGSWIFDSLYQLLSWELKKDAPVTTEQRKAYITRFLSNECETKGWKVDKESPVHRTARRLSRWTTRNLNLSAQHLWGKGRHGPGATYNGDLGSDKNVWSDIPDDLRLSYDYWFFFANESMLAEGLLGSIAAGDGSGLPYRKTMGQTDSCPYPWHSDCSGVSRKRHVESRLTLVPKDYRGPRGVFISPKEAMYVQLAQAREIVSMCKCSWVGDAWDPTSQLPSQVAALQGSQDIGVDRWVTLDLKDASDRIPLRLIAELFHRSDYLCLARSRPSYLWLDKETKVRLGMFSPMGDGKTFPVLSYVCAVICMSAILVKAGYVDMHKFSERELRGMAQRRLRIFGDDIACRASDYVAIVAALESYNLKVNTNKSFALGPFRESCGCDAFNGHVVTPIRLRKCLDTDPLSLLQMIDLHNRLVVAKPELMRTIGYIRSLVETHSHGRIGYTSRPEMQPGSLYVSREAVLHTVLSRVKRVRFNPDLQYVEQCVYRSREVQKYPPSLDPWWDLNFYLISRSLETDVECSPFEGKSTRKIGSEATVQAFHNFMGHLIYDIEWLRFDQPDKQYDLAWVQVV